ncbi:MoaF-related domain-containing protein [Flavobacterium sp.]|uniref:MoaF-related domain-containing protein n=1 Tax=Flavobacterium sp. TaxID=239 RepID=UPI0039E45D98
MKKFAFLYLMLLPIIIFGQQTDAKSFYNKPLTLQFKAGAIHMTIYTDSTLYWKNPSKGTEGKEQSKTIHVDKHTIMTAWQEADKTFVNLLSDFKTRKVSGMVYRPDGKFYPIEGRIEIGN